MTHLQSRNDSEQFEVTPQSDSPVNDALIAIAQEVAEVLKQAYPVQQNKHSKQSHRLQSWGRVGRRKQRSAKLIASTAPIDRHPRHCITGTISKQIR